jgi:hypothetical protein
MNSIANNDTINKQYKYFARIISKLWDLKSFNISYLILYNVIKEKEILDS